MLRTHTCGELRKENINERPTLAGWVQRVRKLGTMIFVDLRDRYGITQLAFNEIDNKEMFDKASKLGREYVISANGLVKERENKNSKIPTGDIEIIVESIDILNTSDTPPFTIEDETDGGEELRMKYRYLDLRRNIVRKNLELRNEIAQEIRSFLNKEQFIEVETPVLIKSTPEGARDFIVPSRVNKGEFYALPQSPQLFKQLLMVSGFDRYYQIVKCFRDEDLRADRQPEFTQLDCEMSFVEQEDILKTFEKLTKNILKTVKNIDIKEDFARMSFEEAMNNYGSDKPDIRFDMKIVDITEITQNKGFTPIDSSQFTGAICIKNKASWSRKDIDNWTNFVKKPQVGANGLFFVKYENEKNIKSSFDKFFNADDIQSVINKMNAEEGDIIFAIAGDKKKTLVQLGELRLAIAKAIDIIDKNKFAPLWVVDFPLFEWSEEDGRFYSTHHPFTSPKKEDMEKLFTATEQVRANAYDLVINGVEIGGGSIRIHNKDLQNNIFKLLGFTDEEAQEKFGFLMNAFKYGAPPHGGIALGFDRLSSLLGGSDTIRDFIAFPKNNAGRDTMIDTPSKIAEEQLNELNLLVKTL